MGKSRRESDNDDLDFLGLCWYLGLGLYLEWRVADTDGGEEVASEE